MSKLSKLPIDDFIPEILQHISSGNNLVITAAPGAGKTTRLPPALLSTISGKILVLEPRRMAAISAAYRIAEENNWTVGEEVGYQVRFNNKTTSNTRLTFMTEALLARQMVRDPELKNVNIVILDEFHERSLYVDLTLGLLRELQELGHPIQIIVMSATLEADKISRYLDDAAIVSVPGKLFPLEIRYQNSTQLLKTQNDFYEKLIPLMKEACLQTDKDILVFLPGVGEIERAKENILAWAKSKNIQVISLHGSLPLDAQRQVLKKSSHQRIILSTNVAESSVTLDGVGAVIDSGLSKVMKQDLRTGFSRLELSRISLSSAIQRSGRAARQYPGLGFRMWSKGDESSFVKSDVPEIMRADLCESLLFLAAQGLRDFENFLWFEKPNTASLERAIRTLKSVGALNNKNELTAKGHQLLHFPLPVRLGCMLIAGIENNCVELAAKMAALLQERDIFNKGSLSLFLAKGLECDLTLRLNELSHFLDKGTSKEGNFITLQTVEQSYRQIVQLAKQLEKQVKFKRNNFNFSEEENRQFLLLSAYGDRLCRRRKNTDRALMVAGRGVKLTNESLVKKSEFFIALSGIEGGNDAETAVSFASGIEKEFLLKNFSAEIIVKNEIIFNPEKEQFYQQKFKSLWDLPLEDPILSPATSAQVADKLPEILTANLEDSLNKSEHLYAWWQKVIFLRNQKEFLSPEIQHELENIFEGDLPKKSLFFEAFTQACLGERKVTDIFKKDLVYFFEINLSPNLRKILQLELPNQLKVPSGSLLPIHYSSSKPPFLEVRIQEVFGWKKTPKVLFQNIPIVLHLLAPNFRPVQITSNLESFWQNSYADVRKELRIRYPKHQWPENPDDGIAEAKGRRHKNI